MRQMVNSRALNSPPLGHRGLIVLLRIVLLGTLVVSGLTALVVWFLPVDIFKNWAFEWAEADEYRQLEAVGQAEFGCWLVRFVAPVIGLVAFRALRRLSRTANFLADAFAGWLAVTQIGTNRNLANLWRTVALRLFFIGWIVVALGHDWRAIGACATNWNYFRFRSGSQVLPNISDSNCEVIRYLREVTPPDARIFVASDQKLYFLSYYLLPRRVYHKSHPDSEFVIPQAYQQRRLEAYKLAEIDPQIIDRIAPDYLLEYFEHPDFVDRSRLYDDRTWLAFFRQTHRHPTAEPNYLVCLRRVEKGRRP